MGKLTILRAGPFLTVQDLGRPHLRASGLAPGGALDLHAARVANLVVGNPENAALLEITYGPVRLHFSDERTVAACGAENGLSLGAAHRIQPHEELELRAAQRGCRSWLAVAGGVEVPMVLGSRSTDLRGHFGGHFGRALRDGDELELGPPNEKLELSRGRAPSEWARTAARTPVLRVVPGAEAAEFPPDWTEARWTVSAKADRMGARLEGSTLRRQTTRELLSEAVTPGTVQVAHDGEPIVLLGDCQTLGGYPKIAHVITVDLPVAAQLRPDDSVRFQNVTFAEARELFAARERDFARFRVGMQLLRA